MFSTQQLKLRNQVAELRSMLPEFDEEDRPDILEVIKTLVSKFKYTFPEDIWRIIKEYAISDISNWFWKSGMGNISLNLCTYEYFQEPHQHLQLAKIEDIKVGDIVVLEKYSPKVIIKITEKTDTRLEFFEYRDCEEVDKEEICRTHDNGIYILYKHSVDTTTQRPKDAYMSLSSFEEELFCIVDTSKPLYIVNDPNVW
jgi:hypothetical protein